MTSRPGKTFIDDFLQHSAYDPQKAHAYYEAHKQLKGRQKGATVVPIHKAKTAKAAPHQVPPELEAQVKHLEGRLTQLRDHLQKLLQSKRQKTSEPKKHETAAEKQKKAAANKKYQQEHKSELKAKVKAKAEGGGGGTPISSMTETQLRSAISRCQANLHAAVAKARAAANGGTA